jgi:peptidoglycan hydrolase-like protein with peptidoglycan-binding domain
MTGISTPSPVLQEGAQGPDVMDLQSRLKQAGFPLGMIDGKFGPATEAAVLTFQNSSGLLADGVVGARTATTFGTFQHWAVCP